MQSKDPRLSEMIDFLRDGILPFSDKKAMLSFNTLCSSFFDNL